MCLFALSAICYRKSGAQAGPPFPSLNPFLSDLGLGLTKSEMALPIKINSFDATGLSNKILCLLHKWSASSILTCPESEHFYQSFANHARWTSALWFVMQCYLLFTLQALLMLPPGLSVLSLLKTQQRHRWNPFFALPFRRVRSGQSTHFKCHNWAI